jgi:Fe-S-cluster containining protein
MDKLDSAKLNTLFAKCRQCGTCCKSYKKVILEPEEIERIKKLGGHVGLMVSLNDLRTANIDSLIEKEKLNGKLYMIHPDDKGCVFLEKKNEKYYCKK